MVVSTVYELRVIGLLRFSSQQLFILHGNWSNETCAWEYRTPGTCLAALEGPNEGIQGYGSPTNIGATGAPGIRVQIFVDGL